MRRRREHGWIWALRAAIVVLALPFLTGGTLASLVAVVFPAAHVCHCGVERHECFCVKCHPDRPDLAVSEESISGRCGDDETPLAGGRFLATLPLAFLAPASAAPSPAPVHAPSVHLPLATRSIPPPTPPPEARTSLV